MTRFYVGLSLVCGFGSFLVGGSIGFGLISAHLMGYGVITALAAIAIRDT